MIPAAAVAGGGSGGGALSFLQPLARGLATVAVGGIGCFLFSTVGSLSYPPHGALVGAVLGLLGFSLIGCCITGFWRDLFVFDAVRSRDASFALLPSPLQAAITGHGPVSLIVTVHEAVGVHVTGRALTSPDLYVEVDCGVNPTKRTCVSRTGVFNEQFRLQVDAPDKTMLFVVKDQDIFGSSNVGFVSLDIRRQILEAEPPFPQREAFPLDAGEGDTLRVGTAAKAALVLSFDRLDVRGQRLHAQPLGLASENQWNSQYGAVKYLSTLQFNPNATLTESKGAQRV